jgi:hypothetical protein
MYQRNGARYKLFPSLVAFFIAATAGAQWIEVMGSIILYKIWPEAHPLATIFLFILLVLAILERGNVARILGRLLCVRATN